MHLAGHFYSQVTGYGVVRDAETSCKLVHIVHVNPKGQSPLAS
jgi:hypothetical protein